MTTQTHETIPGTKAIGTRLANGELSFLALVMERVHCSQEDAAKVLRVYRKLRLVKLDAGLGVISVKHGAYWDAETLRAAIEYTE